jgi:phytoene synthase
MVRKYSVPEKVFTDMIAGQRQDLEPLVLRDFAALHAYCYRVASVVGVASIYVFGFERASIPEETLRMGAERGIAFQLTNILRDLREDAMRGRCYIPEEELQHFGVTVPQLRAGLFSPGFQAMMAHQIARARMFYDISASLGKRIEPDARPTLAAMTDIYWGILEKIAENPKQALEKRVSLSAWTKLMIAWRAMRAGN